MFGSEIWGTAGGALVPDDHLRVTMCERCRGRRGDATRFAAMDAVQPATPRSARSHATLMLGSKPPTRAAAQASGSFSKRP